MLTALKKVQYVHYARFLRICGLRLVNIHVRQVRCILRNCAILDLELFTKPSDRDFLQSRQIATFYECITVKRLLYIPLFCHKSSGA